MKRSITISILGLACTAGIGMVAADARAEDGGKREGAASALPNCPIMGEPVDLSVSTATDAGPVYFCCKGCIRKYQANPDKFATIVAAQRKALAARHKIQVTCPVSRKPVDPKVFVDHDGKKVFFCCKDCVGKFEEEPAKFAAALANSYTYQTKCPVMGEEIDPQAFATAANGQKIYFCCQRCDKKFFADPAKYAAKMAEMGYAFDPAKMARAGKDDGHDGHDHHGG